MPADGPTQLKASASNRPKYVITAVNSAKLALSSPTVSETNARARCGATENARPDIVRPSKLW